MAARKLIPQEILEIEEKISELHLKCYTQAQIAKVCMISQQMVSHYLRKITENLTKQPQYNIEAKRREQIESCDLITRTAWEIIDGAKNSDKKLKPLILVASMLDRRTRLLHLGKIAPTRSTEDDASGLSIEQLAERIYGILPGHQTEENSPSGLVVSNSESKMPEAAGEHAAPDSIPKKTKKPQKRTAKKAISVNES